MKNNKRYYKQLDFIRLLACIAILLYHFNILKGGYLAVCTFLVLSGYLSCISAFKKEKFSIISYYKSRLKIYIPLLIVVFTTVSFTSILPNMSWLNLKPETTSVLLGYNNFWQLSVNLDYFARHLNSPFMHFWYISILLQFEIIFPSIFILLRKIGDKINKLIPCLITLVASLIFTIYFYKMSLTPNIMATYYNTFTRIFSLIFGISLGFIHSYYKTLVLEKLKKAPFRQIIFFSYIIILIVLFVFVDASSKYFAISMILTTLITCRLIDYSAIDSVEKLSLVEKIIKSLSNISYEIYLFQYPIIFIFQNLNLSTNIKLILMIIIIIILSYLLHFSINSKNKKIRILKYIALIIFLAFSIHGAYQYCITKDHTEEMKALEEQLAENEKILQQKQEEYASFLKQEQEELEIKLKDIEADENKLKEAINKLPIVGIGDSVMLGAIEDLYQEFPNGYFDAKISRTAWVANDILQDLINRKLLGGPIIINLGANGDCPESCKDAIMKKCEGKEVFWLNVTNDNEVHFNDKLTNYASKYQNLHIIDWNTISMGHSDYFVADGIHLTSEGRKAYTEAIYNAIYEAYSNKYTAQKDELLKEHEKEQQNKISFYGNDILLNAFDYIDNTFKEEKYTTNKVSNFDALKENIQESVKNNTLNYKIALIIDNSFKINAKQFKEILELCQNHKIYILATNEEILQELSSIEDITIIDFYQEINANENYLMPDKIHLTEEGNKALSQILYTNIINN